MNNQYVRDESHYYVLRSHPAYYFEVGRSGTEQALWGLVGDAAYVLRFSPDGSFRTVEKRSLNCEPMGKAGGNYKEKLRTLSDEMRANHGFVGDSIRVHRFHLQEPVVAIEDVGPDLQEFLADSSSFTDDEKTEWRQALQEWITEGMFALRWEQYFEVSCDGVVESS